MCALNPSWPPGVDRHPCSRPWTQAAGLFLQKQASVLAGNFAPKVIGNTLRFQVERSTWIETRQIIFSYNLKFFLWNLKKYPHLA